MTLKLNRSLFRYEEIAAAGCPVHLRRWTILRLWGGAAVYLHNFVGDDWARDPHDHPKHFWTIGLQGEYWEDVFEQPVWKGTRHWAAPWVRHFPPEHAHRIRVNPHPWEGPIKSGGPGAWSLCIVGGRQREWGFWHMGEWVQWAKYAFGGIGETRKSC